ncbi:N-acetylmuramoyl-L-alanine amidase [Streptomyces sp. NPDC092296]|uniref:N-acetylmuramoyl-L-alanine amidase n=1 Tax=Streptomyces sp. NPDC092296 TaxID=3366012 RepID=UPI003807029D
MTAPPRHDTVPAHPANHDRADRPRDLPITTLVLHCTEEDWATTLAIFTDPARQVSAHWVVRSHDGHLTRMAADRDIAWHAGNWYLNQTSLGIEQEGSAADGHGYTDALYRGTAALVRHLAARHRIPLDRTHLLGHDNVPPPLPERTPAMHTDPGPYYDWARLLRLLGHPLGPTAPPGAPLLAVHPGWQRNPQPLAACDRHPGAPARPANFVPLRSHPDPDAPLLGPGCLHDTTGRAAAGQRFATAGRAGEWTAIWYDGRRAWFHDPADAPTAVPVRGAAVQPRHAPVPVHGRAYPDPADYPAGTAPPAAVPIGRLHPGQRYACGGPVPSVHRIDAATTVTGAEPHLVVQFGHRIGYVRAADVELLPG